MCGIFLAHPTPAQLDPPQLESVLAILQAHQIEWEAFGVKSLAVFGSVARGEARARSDIDLFVEFREPVGIFTFLRLKGYLEKILACSVDLATPAALHNAMRTQILSEAVHAG